MREASVAEELRRLRRGVALPQGELAARTGVPSLGRVRASRERSLEVATRRRVSDVRLSGSVARGEATAGSDVDLLVHPGPDASPSDLAGFMAEIAELLGLDVDVVSDRGDGPRHGPHPSRGRGPLMFDGERVPALLEDVARFAVSARRVAARGHARFVDLSTAADHLPSSFREARPDIDWSGIRPVRDFVAHDHDGTDTEVLWRVIAVEFPRIAAARAE